MVDQLMMPEVHIVVTQVPGVDGVVSAANLAQIENDVAAALARANITKLDDIPDVDAASPANGNTLQFNSATNRWELNAITTGTLDGVYVAGSGEDAWDPISVPARRLYISQGLTAVQGSSSATFAVIRVNWGGTGTANTVARSNHTHTRVNDTRATFAATGTLSSGTRTLVSGNITGLDDTLSYRVSAVLRGDLRGQGTGAGTSLPSIELHTSSVNRFGAVRTVSGVDREYSMAHDGVTVSGMTSFAYAATLAFQSGDPTYVGAGELVISLRANR